MGAGGGGVHNGGSQGRRQTSNLKCLNLFILPSSSSDESDIWSAACAVFLLLHTTSTALIFTVNSLNALFSCFIVLQSLIFTFFIWFPSSFSFSTHHSAIFRSESFSIFSPSLYPSAAYSFFFWLSNHSQLYILALARGLFSDCASLCVHIFFWWVHGNICSQVKTVPYLTFFQLSSPPPVSPVSTISFLLSCHHRCSPPLPPSSSLLSSCTVIRGGSRT